MALRTIAIPERPGDGEGHLVRGSSWMMAGFAVQAVTGLLFWLVAARRFPSADVGRAAAVFASMQFVNYATAMGLQEMLARFHRRAGVQADNLLGWALAATVATSLAGSLAYLAVVDSVWTVLTPPGALAGAAMFFVLSAGGAVVLLTDIRFMEVRRWRWVFWRLVLVGAARVPFLWIPAQGPDDLWLFAVMASPIAVSAVAGVAGLWATGIRPALGRPFEGAEAARYAGVNYVAHLFMLAPQFALPVVVLVNVPAADNANFFLAWAMAAVVAILPVTVGRVLVVEGSRPGADLAHETRRALVLAVAVTAAAAAVTWLADSLVVPVFGSDYSAVARILPVLALGGVPWAVTTVSLAHSRIRHDPIGTVAMTGTLAAGILGLAMLWVPSDGIDGAARAWLVGNLVACGVALALWGRARALPVATGRRDSEASGDSAGAHRLRVGAAGPP